MKRDGILGFISALFNLYPSFLPSTIVLFATLLLLLQGTYKRPVNISYNCLGYRIGLLSSLLGTGGAVPAGQFSSTPVGGHRFGANTSDGSFGKARSSISKIKSPFLALNNWQSLQKPMYQSTPGANSVARIGRGSPRLRTEQQSSFNSSTRSAGSAGEPYLYTTNDSLSNPGGGAKVINRLYRS